ncbi:hypothetical protein QOT17_022406 [Balamuthia mandrillaris]
MLDKCCSGKARFLLKMTSNKPPFGCDSFLPLSHFQKEMGRVEKYLERAAREALRSDCEHKHGACLVKGGKLLALGHNSRLRTRLQCGGFTLCSVHAEMKALYCFK